jgi:hypothetical protein
MFNPQDIEKIAQAMRAAGWTVLRIENDDIFISEEDAAVDEEPLNFTVKDGVVFWCDFGHTTFISSSVDSHDVMVAAFKEMLPLRNDDLKSWIASRQPTFPEDVGVYTVIKPKDRVNGKPKVKLAVVYRCDSDVLRVASNIGEIGVSTLKMMESSTQAGDYIWFGPIEMPKVITEQLNSQFLY